MATDLREALRPVVAFRGELEKSRSTDELNLVLLETNLPEHITRVLDLHHNLLMSLAIASKVEEPDEVAKKVEAVLVAEGTAEAQAKVVQAPKASFLDD